MYTLKKIRTSLGITQPEMAEFLGIGRVMLTLAESGLRKLSINALMKVAILERAIRNTPEPLERNFHECLYEQEWRKKEDECSRQLRILRRQLLAMQDAETRASMLQHVLHELEDNENCRDWVVKMKGKNNYSHKYDLAACCENLRFKIELLETQVTQIRSYLESAMKGYVGT